jgi:hypothetical protein
MNEIVEFPSHAPKLNLHGLQKQMLAKLYFG